MFAIKFAMAFLLSRSVPGLFGTSSVGSGALAVICVLFTAVSFQAPGSANAATVLTLNPEPSPGIQQALNSPCIFGDNSCSNPDGFDRELIGSGNGSFVSLLYTVGQIRDIVGDTFAVGIDIGFANNGNASHFLNYFDMTNVTAGGSVLAIFDPAGPGPALGGGNNPGNGFSDFALSLFNLTGLDDAVQIAFNLNLTGRNDGPDQFFIYSVAPIPLPAALPLFGAALGGLGLLGWRSRKRRVAATA